LKHSCRRCCQHFSNDEELLQHQQAETACKVSKRSARDDVITDEQEKKLRVRAKPNMTEEEKWIETYRILFPGEKVPSACKHHLTIQSSSMKDDVTDSIPADYESNDTLAVQSTKAENRSRQVQDKKEYVEYIRREVPRVVRPMFERIVENYMQKVQEQMNKKANEVFEMVIGRLTTTFDFGASLALTPADSTAAGALDDGTFSPPASSPRRPSPMPPQSPDRPTIEQVLNDDQLMGNFYNNNSFEFTQFFLDNPELLCLDNDSAYWSANPEGDGSY